VGLTRLLARRDERGLPTVVRVRAWPLELVNAAPTAAALVSEEIDELTAEVAPELFRGFDRAAFPASSRPALALAAAAYRLDDATGERVSMALRHALFEEGRDLAAPEVLTAIAHAHGVPAPGPRDDAAVLADWHEGRRRGVRGSPHFFLGEGDGYFCPALDITRVDDRLRIRSDPAGFEEFVARALAAA
jgi:predicted DsbA family dithiol-disulfide isomerase